MNIEERIDRIERESRRWRFLAISLALVIGCWLFYSVVDTDEMAVAADTDKSAIVEEVRTSRLLIVDSEGKTVGRFESGKSGCYFQMRAKAKGGSFNVLSMAVDSDNSPAPNPHFILSGDKGFVSLETVP